MELNQAGRSRPLDALKFLAIFIVYTTHFFDDFYPEAFRLGQELPTSLLLKGFTGKFGVAVFGVLLSCFAFLKGRKKKEPFLSYALKRYAYFVLCGLLINSVYLVCSRFGLVTLSAGYSVPGMVVCSLLLGDGIFPTFWCMKPFLAASLLAFLAGRRELPAWAAAVTVAILTGLSFFGMSLWIPISLLGILAVFLSEGEKTGKALEKGAVQLILFLAVMVAKYRDESRLTYFIDGLCAVAIVLLVLKNRTLYHLLDRPFLAALGSRTMEVFLIHPIVYELLGGLFLEKSGLSQPVGAWLAWVLCFVVICALAFPVSFLLRKLNGLCTRVIDGLFRLLRKPSQAL